MHRQGSQGSSAPRTPTRTEARQRWLSWAAAFVLSTVVAFAFQGSRSIWEPDEGRYANGALAMLESGDWLLPQVDGVVYLDKPPLIYWLTATSMKLFGVNEWSFRLIHALALIFSAALVGALAARLWGRDSGPLAMAAYSTTLFAVVGSFAVTPDALLTGAVIAASYCYWRCFESDTGRTRWGLGLAFAACAGVLSKGPAMLVFLAPLVVHAAFTLRAQRSRKRFDLVGWPLFGAALGAIWYLAVGLAHPGAFGYWIDNQIAGRLWANHYHRHPEWWGPLVVYLPVLTLGMLPTSAAWPRAAADWWARRRNGWTRLTPATAQGRWLLTGIAVPLLVLCLASSRLPLYVLPLTGLLTVASAGLWRPSGAGRPGLARWATPGVAAVLAISLKAVSPGFAPPGDDGALMATALEAEAIPADTPIVAARVKLHSLRFYGYQRVIWTDASYPYYQPPPSPEHVLWLENGLESTREVVVVGEPRVAELIAGMSRPCRRIDHQALGYHVYRCAVRDHSEAVLTVQQRLDGSQPTESGAHLGGATR